MNGSRLVIILVLLLAPATALTQPTMESLWPNPDGMRWGYEYHVVLVWPFEIDFTGEAFLAFDGTVTTPGGLAQNLLAEHDSVPGAIATGPPTLPPVVRTIWLARPDLRTTLETRYADPDRRSDWWPLFLHDGPFLKGSDSIVMWQEGWDQPTWKYLEADLTVGASFTIQLMEGLADDIFLHGTVAAVGATVETLVDTFDNAVKIDYLLDLGIQIATNEDGEEIGEAHAESRGHVYYVPDVGPVDLYEEYTPFVWFDCGENDCPPEWEEMLGIAVQIQTLSLDQMPVPARETSWGDMKRLFRP